MESQAHQFKAALESQAKQVAERREDNQDQALHSHINGAQFSGQQTLTEQSALISLASAPPVGECFDPLTKSRRLLSLQH
jgi:hypothetical protein